MQVTAYSLLSSLLTLPFHHSQDLERALEAERQAATGLRTQVAAAQSSASSAVGMVAAQREEVARELEAARARVGQGHSWSLNFTVWCHCMGCVGKR